MIELHNERTELLLPKIAANSIGAIVSDFPYGLRFMSKKWDYDLPSIEALTEHYRVLKPGGYLLGFSSPRTYHRLACRLEDVGFEIRDCIQWIYGSGFPKGKSCLKPAYEPIIVCRKPGKIHPLNIDECRIALNGDHKGGLANRTIGIGETINEDVYSKAKRAIHDNSVGRWPANIILDEDSAAELDDSSGVLNTCVNRMNKKHYGNNGNIPFVTHRIGSETQTYNDIGGASRFFYVAKSSPSDRNYGLTDKKNTHPTVKPIKLMRYLVKLVKQEGETIADFYMGSGTTGIACALEGVDFIGNDMELHTYETAKERIEFAERERLNSIKPQDLFPAA